MSNRQKKACLRALSLAEEAFSFEDRRSSLKIYRDLFDRVDKHPDLLGRILREKSIALARIECLTILSKAFVHLQVYLLQSGWISMAERLVDLEKDVIVPVVTLVAEDATYGSLCTSFWHKILFAEVLLLFRIDCSSTSDEKHVKERLVASISLLAETERAYLRLVQWDASKGDLFLHEMVTDSHALESLQHGCRGSLDVWEDVLASLEELVGPKCFSCHQLVLDDAMACRKCAKVRRHVPYCSRACRKAHARTHKKSCGSTAGH